MTGLDTNILVRFLVNDDKAQAARVKRFFLKAEDEGETLYISNPVVLELLYVLGSVYGYGPEEILTALASMLSIPVFSFENHDLIHELVERGRVEKIDLDDLFIGLKSITAGCATTITFDKKASRSGLFTMLNDS